MKCPLSQLCPSTPLPVTTSFLTAAASINLTNNTFTRTIPYYVVRGTL